MHAQTYFCTNWFKLVIWFAWANMCKLSPLPSKLFLIGHASCGAYFVLRWWGGVGVGKREG